MSWECRILRDVAWPDLELAQQECIAEVRENPSRAFLLISEPRATFTFGRFATESGLLWDRAEIERRGIEVHQVARGGQWTYHGPGQILVYPICDVRSLGYPRHAAYRFVKQLSSSLRSFWAAHGIDTEERSKPFGLYAQAKKLVSFGMAFEQGISSHGLALYHGRQGDAFHGIHPCGCPGQQNVSLEELKWPLDWNGTALGMAEGIKKGFKHN